MLRYVQLFLISLGLVCASFFIVGLTAEGGPFTVFAVAAVIAAVWHGIERKNAA